QNFIIILSPGLIDQAPHSFLATVSVARDDEERLYRAITDAFPTVTTVRVRDVIAQLDSFLRQLNFAVWSAGLMTILTGLLVLSGAIAAGHRTRLHESVVMKVHGATRNQILGVHILEFAVIGTVTGLVALAVSAAAAWAATHYLLETKPDFDLETGLITVAGGAASAILFGLGVSWQALAAKPARLLRNP
ncbi:MAG TPA: FtsX-like permease family protein, partial [Rhizomicrobium sp.]